MNLKELGPIHITYDPVVKDFSNGSAVIINPDIPEWIRTSCVGVWILDLLRRKPLSADEVIVQAAKHYGIPSESISVPMSKFLEILVTHGYARTEYEPNNREIDEYHSDTVRKTDNSTQRLEDLNIQQLWLHITSRCNLRCEHCYYPLEHPGRELSLDKAKRLFDEAASLGITQIIISGGEPMLHSQILDIVKSCRNTCDWYIKLVSNGTIVDEEVFDQIIQNIDDLQISIDGIDKTTHDKYRGKGSFERAVRAFLRLYETAAGVCRGISFTPLPENIDQIPMLNKLGYELTADYIHLNHPKIPAQYSRRVALEKRGFLGKEFLRRALQNFRSLCINILSDYGAARGMNFRPLYLDASFNYATALTKTLRLENCGAGITNLGFDPQCIAYPCAALTGREECKIGEFPNKSLKDIHAEGRNWNKLIFSVDSDPSCSQCIYRYFCGGGCRAVNETLSDRDIFCSVIRESYDLFFKYVSLPKIHIEPQILPKSDRRGVESC